MAECNSHNIYPNVSANTSNEQQFRLNKFATVIGTSVGMMSPSSSLAFSITTGIVKKLLKTI